MKLGMTILLANLPAIVCASIGGLLVDRGHPWFATALLVLAYSLGHSFRGKDE